MSVSNGQKGNATVLNAAFVSKTADSTSTGSLVLNKPAEGASVTVQSDINTLKSTATSHGSRLTALESGEIAIKGYADDAAYVAANGTATAGDVYYNTTSNKIKWYNGSVWSDIGSGGGGGGSIQWIEDSNAPLATVENKVRVYNFEAGLAQELHTIIKVPAGYTSGSPIKLRTYCYSSDATATMLIQTVATLIRTGTDTLATTTNQRTSTNSAITQGMGTVSIPQALTLDLTHTDGTINSVAVSAGDIILVKLTRGTDTSTVDVSVPVNGAEVTFS